MYQLKKIIYKSVFKSDQQKEVIEYKEEGKITQGRLREISFQTNGHVISIHHDDHQVILSHDGSTLHLLKDKLIQNQYKLYDYEVSLTTKLINLVVRDDFLGIKYELYDGNGLISTVYITINMISL